MKKTAHTKHITAPTKMQFSGWRKPPKWRLVSALILAGPTGLVFVQPSTAQ
jgi:hypothetical protein